MTFDEMKQRVASLTQMCEQTAGQHNAMCGRLQEAKDLLAFMEKQASDSLEAVDKLMEAENTQVATLDVNLTENHATEAEQVAA